MATFAITGKDTFEISDRVFTDFADGDASTIAFPNDLVTMKTGKEKNTIYSANQTGNNCDVVLRLVRGSGDDKFMNSLLSEQKADLASFPLMKGSFIKKIGDGEGNLTSDAYALAGGVFKTQVDAKENVEGDTESVVAIYNLAFATGDRALS